MESKNHLKNNPIKTDNRSQISACEQQMSSEKANFSSNTIFSLQFKISLKKFHVAKPVVLWLRFMFRRDQNHHFKLTSKITKMFEQNLKTAPRKNLNSLNRKKPSERQ